MTFVGFAKSSRIADFVIANEAQQSQNCPNSQKIATFIRLRRGASRLAMTLQDFTKALCFGHLNFGH
jgi:mRNA-degrading endonuclease RelE of RelBE toxin-antitoxin system